MLQMGAAKGGSLSLTKFFTRHISMKGDVHLSNRRVMRKIKLGKARPAIFHQFNTLVELSDGSVVTRRSQAPKDEIRMISDQRNSPLWNPHRSDLSTADPNATGKLNKFRQRFALFESFEVAKDQDSKPSEGLLDMMSQNVQEVQAGGKLFNKKLSKK